MNFNHIPILKDEIIRYLNIVPQGVYVDGTLGGAGHGQAICKELNKEGLFIYGSCSDLLLNDFKVTELVFVRI